LIAGPICPLLKQSASFGDFDVRSLTVTQVQQSSNTWTRYSAYDSMAVEEDLFYNIVGFLWLQCTTLIVISLLQKQHFHNVEDSFIHFS
jgi:hypothetical protein